MEQERPIFVIEEEASGGVKRTSQDIEHRVLQCQLLFFFVMVWDLNLLQPKSNRGKRKK
jgi:hypothetical protein